uniref:tetratricopeptide repeat protein n=1 Tax=Parerythrobacter lutipelagi TaxID=1964208 RepID=UPI0010F71895|nr:tetratricopeptide repeat protein [Parerythrobacter lutipelagi]
MISRASRVFAAGLAFAAVAGASAPVIAQDSGAEARLRKVEAEVRALQRQVFPGGDGRYFEPEITAPAGTPRAASSSTTAVTDILIRLDALEAQIASLTAQTEENTNAISGLTARLDAMGTATSAAQPVSPSASPASSTNEAAVSAAAAQVTPEVAAPTPARLAAVSAIAKPQTEDAGDDEYSYGFRLWDAGFYPEAQQQLTMFVEQYPDHSRATYGRNLLGRAYLDDGKPNDAATWFLKNYQADKNANRAPDSLLYLAESMIALKDERRACIALAEFGETYPAIASGRLSDQFQANLRKVDCD